LFFIILYEKGGKINPKEKILANRVVFGIGRSWKLTGNGKETDGKKEKIRYREKIR